MEEHPDELARPEGSEGGGEPASGSVFPDLPEGVEEEIDRLLNGPQRLWESGFDGLARAHPDHSAAILGLLEMFAAPPPEPAPEDTAAERPTRVDPTLGTSVGPYTVVKALGEGGMGTVYLAEQSHPVRRKVALKVIKAGMDSELVLSRFELERQALALMSHENIAKVYDAGTTGLGQPYFVMEFVPGLPLARHCDRFMYTVELRLELFLRVCAGVQHAHLNGIIHRDLKPANILVSSAQDRPTPKIIDFGLARAAGSAMADGPKHSLPGITLGTPEYMSPEQAGAGIDVDTRSDVYSLGVVLYELLTGLLPFPSDRLRSRSLSEIHNFLETADVPRPSVRLGENGDTLADRMAARRSSREVLATKLRSDLDWIVLKAMATQRAERYTSPGDLAADVRRYLRNEPVEAAPPTAGYRLKKYWRRHRIKMTAVGLVGLAVVGGGTGTALGLVEARSANNALVKSEAKTRQALDKAETYLSQLGLLELGDQLEVAREDPAVDAVAWPENAAAIRAWVDERGAPLTAAQRTVRDSLQELRQRAQPSPGASEPSYLDWNDSYLDRRLTALDAAISEFDRDGALLDQMKQRAAWAETVAARSIDAHRARWDEAIAAIGASDGVSASTSYGQLALSPQVGLVPVGMDPVSKLWEFVHLRSAGGDRAVPVRQPDGSLSRDEHVGIVFVLVPGGRAVLGAAPDDPRHRDPYAVADDGPSYEVSLEPYFLSKHELTQSQWQELAGANPSALRVGTRTQDGKAFTWLNPVEQVSWFEAMDVMGSYGLRIPTEQEWEHSCRAGSTAPWSCGDYLGLSLVANLADKTAAGMIGWEVAKELDDGFLGHAPTGSLGANAWGLHDLHGNVNEWCSSRYGLLPSQQADDNYELAPDGPVIVRGGAFSSLPTTARSSARLKYPPGGQYQSIGVRAARSVLDG